MDSRGRDLRRVPARYSEDGRIVRAKSSSAIYAKPQEDPKRGSIQIGTLQHKRGGFGRPAGELLLYVALNNAKLSEKHKRVPKLNTDSGGSENEPTFTNPRYLDIPEHRDARPQIRRWKSSVDTSSRSLAASSLEDPFMPSKSQRPLTNGSSISPLTVLRDQYDTSRPQINYASTDNTFRDLNREAGPGHQEKEQKDDDILHSDKLAMKIYSKMTNVISIAQHGINSLVPSRFHGEVDQEFGTARPPNSNRILTSESEDEDLDADDDETENESLPGRDRDDSKTYEISDWDSPAINSLKVGKKESTDNFHDIMKEITDFQSNFVNKFGEDTNSRNEKYSRTQQRILDYKELETNTVPLSLGSAVAFESYNYRIQYETIINQYSSIRFRFASKTITKDNKIRVDTGVLGFINRQDRFDYYKATDTGQPKLISEDNKDLYLQKLWDSEYARNFKTSTGSPETSASLGSSVVSSNTNFSNTCTNNSLSTGNMSMLEMARSVKLGHATN